MTGRYPMRHGLQTLVIFPSHTYGLPTDERTLPQALKDAGYDTAMVGKWHLGHADQKYWPRIAGSTISMATLLARSTISPRRGVAYRLAAHHLQQRQWRRHQRSVRHRGAVAGRTGRKRRRGARAKDPGFEWGVPRREGVATRRRRPRSVDLLLAHETEAWRCQRTFGMVDVMPTVLALAGAEGSPDHPFDGKDMWPTLCRTGQPSHRTTDILINVEAFRGAIRKGNWKLVKIALLPGKDGVVRSVKGPRREAERRGSVP